jgi:DNA modification methylase
MSRTYEQFLAAKFQPATPLGFEVSREEMNPHLKPFTRDIAQWAVHGGRRAIFASFGLHKTATQLEIMRLIGKRNSELGSDNLRLIVMPLGVRHEFRLEADARFAGEYAAPVKFIRRISEVDDERTIYLTNYESVREGILDVSKFGAVSLDEASVLRGRGNKTFGEFTFNLFRETKYKFVATATPSPNEYQELLSYAAFLDVMDIGAARTRFFKRNSEKADNLTLHPHKEREFWLWLSTWAIFLQRPSDLGYSDEGYALPELDVKWHEVATDHRHAGEERSGQAKLIKNAAIGVQDAAREKRDSLDVRIHKMREIINESRANFLIWHDLEDERRAIEKAVPVAVSVYGSQDLDEREKAIIAFSEGQIAYLAAKPVIAGSGCNFQRHCHRAIFLGIGFKFNDFIQAIHRIHRFLQTRRVRIDLIYTEAERDIRQVLERKWQQHNELTAKMSEIIRQYGLATNALQQELTRSIGVERQVITGESFEAVNDDSVYDARQREADSVGLVMTSIPFSTQYEYTPSYNDFGHTDSNEHFFEQMDFLTPELLRILKPGRVAAVHVKDRIVPGSMSQLGFQTVYPFHSDVISHFKKHGFAFLGMKTIVTDVVRENNQTYRLGWTEQCKDGSRMGAGLPEYLLLFRKPPSDRGNGYADEPVVKSKDDYTRSRWQIDAHGFMRSSGNRLLSAEDLKGQPWGVIYRMFRGHSFTNVYDYEEHVRLSEQLEKAGRLPVDFMLLPPQSWHPDVWTDVTRMRSLNSSQSSAGRQMHVCPLQFDIVDRVIRQFSMPGEVVYDPFGGLMTVPYRAIALKRRGIGCELNAGYFQDGVSYCRAAEAKASAPTLFDLLEPEPPIDQAQEKALA